MRRILIAVVLALLACKSRRSPPPAPVASALPAGSFRAPVWETPLPGDYAWEASVAGEKLVVQTDVSLVVLDRRSGKKLWDFKFGEPSGAETRLAEDVLVVAQQDVKGRDIGAFDLATGKVLWHVSGFGGGGFSDSVHTNDLGCDRCKVMRRDLHTGQPKWTITMGPGAGSFLSKLGPAARGSLIAYRGGPYVMLVSGEEEGERVYAADAKTGARHASMLYAGLQVLTDRTLVGAEPGSRDCKVLMRGVDILTGKQRWRTELRVILNDWDSSECAGRPRALSSDTSLLGLVPNTLFSIDAQDRPIALDLDSGVVRWTGPRGLVPIDADERTVLVRDASGLELEVKHYATKGRLAALDAATGKLLWTAPKPPLEGTYPATAVYGDVVLEGHFHDGRQITVRDARTGVERQPIEGSLISAGPGWLLATYLHKLRYYTFP